MHKRSGQEIPTLKKELNAQTNHGLLKVTAELEETKKELKANRHTSDEED